MIAISFIRIQGDFVANFVAVIFLTISKMSQDGYKFKKRKFLWH